MPIAINRVIIIKIPYLKKRFCGCNSLLQIKTWWYLKSFWPGMLLNFKNSAFECNNNKIQDNLKIRNQFNNVKNCGKNIIQYLYWRFHLFLYLPRMAVSSKTSQESLHDFSTSFQNCKNESLNFMCQ